MDSTIALTLYHKLERVRESAQSGIMTASSKQSQIKPSQKNTRASLLEKGRLSVNRLLLMLIASGILGILAIVLYFAAFISTSSAISIAVAHFSAMLGTFQFMTGYVYMKLIKDIFAQKKTSAIVGSEGIGRGVIHSFGPEEEVA
jgi:hypothetical protein